MALEDPQKKINKKYKKKLKLSGFFNDFGGLNYSFYQLFEATFQSSVLS